MFSTLYDDILLNILLLLDYTSSINLIQASKDVYYCFQRHKNKLYSKFICDILSFYNVEDDKITMINRRIHSENKCYFYKSLKLLYDDKSVKRIKVHLEDIDGGKILVTIFVSNANIFFNIETSDFHLNCLPHPPPRYGTSSLQVIVYSTLR